jgi:hypothetical protein
MTTPTLIEKLVEQFRKEFVYEPPCYQNPNKEIGGTICPAFEVVGSPASITSWLRTSLLTIQKAERDVLREWAKEQLKLDKEAVPVGAYEQAWEDGLQSALFALDIRLRHLDEQDKTNER